MQNETLLAILYILTFISFIIVSWFVFKDYSQRVKTVYVPMLDNSLSEENKLLQSKLYSLDVRFRNMQKNYTKALEENVKLKKDIDDIFKMQNKYKDV
jgi:hypothetical protein